MSPGIPRLGNHQNNELRTSITDINQNDTPFYSDGKVARTHALQPHQLLPAGCLHNRCGTYSFANSYFIIFATISWLPDPGFQILASRSWLSDLDYQIRATYPGNEVVLPILLIIESLLGVLTLRSYCDYKLLPKLYARQSSPKL